jgi:hypothetical protein
VTAAAIAVAAVLAVLAVLFVARPFLRNPDRSADEVVQPDAGELERIRLAEERDRALAALKELEFDRRTGKITDADYRELVGPLRREAAEALRQVDAAAQGKEPPA